MGALVLDVLLVALASVIGGGAGWFLRGGGPLDTESDPETEAALLRARKDNEALRDQVDASTEENVKLKDELDAARLDATHAKDALGELHRVAANMSANVSEHNRSVQEISDGLDVESDPTAIVQCVEQLFTANSKMQSQLAEAEKELEEKQKEIASHLQEARTDALTGLHNRRAFDLEMQNCEDEFVATGRQSSMMVIDVDHFKKFNDTFGHQAGDEVLRGVARVLNEAVTVDDLVCRYGGEEFCVIFPGSSIQEAIPTAEKARAAIADATFHHEEQELKVTASGGLAEFIEGENYEAMVKRADDALYVCKEAGRNCGHWHDGENSNPMTIVKTAKPGQAAHQGESATTDALTGLSTRAPFEDDLARRVAALRRGGEPLSVLLLRIDGYDAVTEGFGPQASDRVLKTTAQFMEAAMRETDHLSRFDVDQFAMILPGAGNEDAIGIADRIREVAELSKLPTNAGLLQFTVSQSVTEGVTGESVDVLLGRLEQGLNEAHEDGGNCCKPVLVDAVEA